MYVSFHQHFCSDITKKFTRSVFAKTVFALPLLMWAHACTFLSTPTKDTIMGKALLSLDITTEVHVNDIFSPVICQISSGVCFQIQC